MLIEAMQAADMSRPPSAACSGSIVGACLGEGRGDQEPLLGVECFAQFGFHEVSDASDLSLDACPWLSEERVRRKPQG